MLWGSRARCRTVAVVLRRACSSIPGSAELADGFGLERELEERFGQNAAFSDEVDRSVLTAIDRKYARKEEEQGKEKLSFLSVLQEQDKGDGDRDDDEDDDEDDQEDPTKELEEEEEEGESSDEDLGDAPLSERASSALIEFARRDEKFARSGVIGGKSCFLDWSKLRRTIVADCVEAMRRRTPATDLKLTLESWDGMVGNRLVANVISRMTDVDSALAFFRFAGQQYNFAHDAFSYGALMRFFLRAADDPRRAMLVFDHVERARVMPSVEMMELLVEAAAILGDGDAALKFVDVAWRKVGKVTPMICRRAIEGLCKAGRIDDAVEFFESRMDFFPCEREEMSSNALLAGLCEAGRIDQALAKLQSMQARSVRGYVILIQGFARLDDLEKCLELAGRMEGEGIPWTAPAYTAVIELLGRSGRIEDAIARYDRMVEQRCQTDPGTHNTMLRVLGDRPGTIDKRCEVVERMAWSGHTPDGVQFSRILCELADAGKKQAIKDLLGDIARSVKSLDREQCLAIVARLCGADRVALAMKFYRVMICRKTMLDGETFATLFAALCRAGKADEAYALFAKLEEAAAVEYDGATHRRIFEELCRARRIVQAYKVYAAMVRRSLSTDEAMLTSLLEGFLDSSQHRIALGVYRAMIRRGFAPSAENSRRLSEILGKAGEIECAEGIAAVAIEREFFSTSPASS